MLLFSLMRGKKGLFYLSCVLASPRASKGKGGRGSCQPWSFILTHAATTFTGIAVRYTSVHHNKHSLSIFSLSFLSLCFYSSLSLSISHSLPHTLLSTILQCYEYSVSSQVLMSNILPPVYIFLNASESPWNNTFMFHCSPLFFLYDSGEYSKIHRQYTGVYIIRKYTQLSEIKHGRKKNHVCLHRRFQGVGTFQMDHSR